MADSSQQQKDPLGMFRSEMHIPVTRDTKTFQDRQRDIFDNTGMTMDMDRQRRQWESDLDRVRQDFFHLQPFDSAAAPAMHGASPTTVVDEGKNFVTEPDGSRKFRARFDVAGFNPDEIKVTTDNGKVIVHALHEEKRGTSNVTKEFRRQVDIPQNISPESLHCLMSADGILTLEAPLQTPNYQALTHEKARPVHAPPPAHISPHSSPRQSSPISRAHQPSSRSPPTSTMRLHTTQATPPRSSGLMAPSGNGFSPMPAAGGGPVIVEEGGVKKMKLRIEQFNFAPEELQVKTQDRRLKISASHEEKTDGCTMSRQFNKEYDLPETVDHHAISAFIDTDGALVVEGPLKHEFQPPKRGVAVTVQHQ